MNDQTKSLIRHILTVLGTIVTLIGLNTWLPVLTFLQSNLDQVWEAVNVVVGLAVTLYGFFFKRNSTP